jgi:hypothetical protein
MRWWRSCYISMFACSGGKIFFDGMDQENSKTQGGKKKKRFFFKYMEVPILMCSPSVGNTLVLVPLCDPRSGENPLVWEPPLQHVHPLSLASVPGGRVSLLLD